MFYQGDLRSGINAAIEQSKLVACYVRSQDDNDETIAWENDFLTDPEITNLITSKAILLRLWSPSEEASFLAQICPIVKLPTLVVIHNGAMKEYLTSGISKEDFLNRLKPVLRGEESSFSPEADIPAASEVSANTRGAPSTGQNQSSDVAALLEERKVRMEAEKRKKDAEEKAERTRKAAERKAALEVGQPKDPKRAADLKYALLQKKRQQEAREERDRVLKQIEDDKAERKARESERKEQARIMAAAEESNPFTAPSSDAKSIMRGDHCALQVRLFDGSAIRSRFSSGATLENEVRKWIDREQQVAESPYTFKHILTPLPNKEISMSEETKSLQDLGLVPSATLVLIPVADFTPAYGQGSGVTGLLSSGVSAGYGLVTSGFGLAARVLGSVVASPAQGEIPTAAPPPQRELRQREQHQLYNGGGLNFEPRRDREDKED